MHPYSDNQAENSIESIFMHTFLSNKEVLMKTASNEIPVFFEDYKNNQLLLHIKDPLELSLWSTIHASDGNKTVYIDVRLVSRISKNVFAFTPMRVRIIDSQGTTSSEKNNF